MHTANLSGVWGRTKKWDYWAILAGDLIVSGVYADVDYLGTVERAPQESDVRHARRRVRRHAHRGHVDREIWRARITTPAS